MSESAPVIADVPPLSEEAVERLARQRAEACFYEDLFGFGWITIGRGIIVAGGAYPMVLALCYISLTGIVELLTGSLTQSLNPRALFLLLWGGAGFGVIAGLVGLVWTTAVTLITLPVVHLVVWSLKIRLSPAWLGGFYGGLVAFIAILPMTMQITEVFNAGWSSGALAMIVFGPGLATIVGQYGGARGGQNAAWRMASKNASRQKLIAIGWRQLDHDETIAAAEDDAAKFRFRTIDLLWLGLWLSLMLTVIRLSQIPYEFILPLIGGWLVYQAATIALGWWLAMRVAPWWRQRRQIRST